MTSDEFRTLYEEHFEAVAAFVYHCMGGGGHAWNDLDDIVQRVFIKVAQNYGRFRGQSSVRTWILAIARNEIASFHRARRHIRQEFPSGDTPLEGVAMAESAEDEAIHRDERMRLRALVWALPMPMRAVVVLMVYHGLTSAEAGQVMGWSAARVRVTYHRALRRLRKQVETAGQVDMQIAGQVEVDAGAQQG
ncbi:RNA polymerase sigma factor [Alicyclobacillus macrosporangiidus]|uniref:RNA polymerase sigma factor n=1 Tax=Alicyclobacillus macrosporangiidus TaxID=392015 RepID=UPI0005514FA3|nr:RNA polymerase sigma factor [Alicyclobacillus macrosporangiidus]